VDTRAYHPHGRLTSWATGSIDSRTYGYDANGNITGINATTFGYDWLDRIVSSNSMLNFTWDANGNRQADGTGSYAYSPSSNRMTSNPSGAVTLDAAGNTLSANGLNFEFNQAGRLTAARSSGNLLGQYAYSFDGHRAQKAVQGATTLFHYGVNDNLLAETDAAGTTLKEYVWDDEGRPLAQIANGVITYLHPDHLGSPRIGTNGSMSVVWQWYEIPFGQAPPSGPITINLRYPGQYIDLETGLFQNWNRAFDPTSGRYLESDHIGLNGGHNTYSYAESNPLNGVDETGLQRSPRVATTPSVVRYSEQVSYDLLLAQIRAIRPDYRPPSAIGNRGDSVSEGEIRLLREDLSSLRGGRQCHGNNLNTLRPAQGYSLRDIDTGEVLKYGETIRGPRRYSRKYLFEQNAEMVFEAQGSKREMHQWQHDMILEYRDQNDGLRPPLNKSDW
ncbi:MAG: hypothetical protein E6R09_04450, partial [Rhodocyclaceae bacterium]